MQGLLQENKKEFIRDIVAIAGLLLLPLFLYLPSFHFNFLFQWDDRIFFVSNPKLDLTLSNLIYYFTNPFQDLYTPLTMYSLMVDKALFGIDPLPCRIHNFLLHFLGSLFFYLTLRKYFKIPLLIAFFSVLLWAVHPQKVESVAWIAERKDVLSGALFFASYYFFLGSMKAKRVPILSSILAILAIMAKPSAIPLPGVMIVTYFAFYGKKGWNKEALKILFLPLFATLSLILYSSFVTAKTNPGVLETNILVPLHNIFWYPLRSILPTTHPFYPPLYLSEQLFGVVPLGVGMAILLLLGMIHCGWGKRKILASFLIIGGLMVPVLGLLKYTNFHYCDRYNYLVSAGVFTVIAMLGKSLAGKSPKNIRLITGLLAIGTIIFSVQTLYTIPHWKDSKTLFSVALNDTRPSNEQFYTNGAFTAIVNDDSAMLRKIAEKMEKDHKIYGKNSEKIRIRAKTYFLQSCIMKGDYAKAHPYYRELDKLIKKGVDLQLDSEYAKIFFRNMGMAAAVYRENKTALLYLEKYFTLQKTPSLIYYMTLALKAQLLHDGKLLEEALVNLVRLCPERDEYKKALENLRRK